MFVLCFLSSKQICFVHSFHAKDYIILTRHTEAPTILTQNYTKTQNIRPTPLYFSKYLEQLGNRFAS